MRLISRCALSLFDLFSVFLTIFSLFLLLLFGSALLQGSVVTSNEITFFPRLQIVIICCNNTLVTHCPHTRCLIVWMIWTPTKIQKKICFVIYIFALCRWCRPCFTFFWVFFCFRFHQNPSHCHHSARCYTRRCCYSHTVRCGAVIVVFCFCSFYLAPSPLHLTAKFSYELPS